MQIQTPTRSPETRPSALRPLLYFTAVTLVALAVLILFIDQPLTRFIHQHSAWAVPFFAAYTTALDNAYSAAVGTRLAGLPALYVGLILAYVVGRRVLRYQGLRRRGATLFLTILLTHIASQGSSNVLKGVVHRLRPEVLLSTGYTGTGLLATGPHNDSFPSTHTAIYLSLFWPLAVAFPRFRVPLLVLPGLIMVGRLVLGMHYVSDVWFSAWQVVVWTAVFNLLLTWRGKRARQRELAG